MNIGIFESIEKIIKKTYCNDIQDLKKIKRKPEIIFL